MPNKWVSRLALHRFPKSVLEVMYLEKKKSYREICNELELNWRTLKKLLLYYNIPIRYWAEAIKAQWIWDKWEERRLNDRLNSKYKTITTDWYYAIRFDWKHRSLDRKRVKEHILIMEDLIGRRLVKWEVVHHKDWNKLNNLPSNLEMMTASEHNKLHRNDMLKDENGTIIWKKHQING